MVSKNSIRDKVLESAQRTLSIEAEAILNVATNLNDSFVEAVDLIFNCKGRVIVSGMGKSGIIGRKISSTLSSTGTPSFYLHPAEGSHGDSGAMMKNDVIILISNSGETDEITSLLPIIKRLGIKLIAFTGNPNSILATKADVFLNIAVDKEACPLNLAPTASTTVTLALGDALSVVLLEKRNFTHNDFLLYHPSGRLGKGLLWTVDDLMHKGDDIPVVRNNSSFKDALIEITNKKLGLSIVIDDDDRAIGIITDGDVRRALSGNFDINTVVAEEIMTVKPKTIDKEELSASALKMMEDYSITSLLVVDDHYRIEGVLHIHDLLKAGVA